MTEENKPSLTIRQWKEDDRPREKLLLKGRVALSDAELISMLIGTGSKGESALDLAKRILRDVDHSLFGLGRLQVADLMRYKGIGKAKAVSIITAMELGRRSRNDYRAGQKPRILNSRSVFELMQPLIGELPHEEFWILYLNNANRVEEKSQLSKGGITATLVDVRLIYKKALSRSATSIVLCHNHPSGNLVPSHSDKLLTEKIVRGGELLDIKVLDHLILSDSGYYSFADENAL